MRTPLLACLSIVALSVSSAFAAGGGGGSGGSMEPPPKPLDPNYSQAKKLIEQIKAGAKFEDLAKKRDAANGNYRKRNLITLKVY